ncbi:hypothetical protein KPH14_004726 [Odynerus spinipes]|uniref:Chitin-binding type-2 domain-containing protein n=1 Tax=Odynerus spinipes TaxID=1348599 RepID=A0AAD9VPN7_9HYME|nr:hypothetical protein KPH14_004726 [Odynerus spinipes]
MRPNGVYKACIQSPMSLVGSTKTLFEFHISRYSIFFLIQTKTPKNMKYLLALQCICLIAVVVYASPPFGIPEENLSPNCQTPKCPEAKDGALVVKPVNLTYPLDCLLYVACKPEFSIESCPSDEVFNKNTGRCDTPENAKCVPCWKQAA